WAATSVSLPKAVQRVRVSVTPGLHPLLSAGVNVGTCSAPSPNLAAMQSPGALISADAESWRVEYFCPVNELRFLVSVSASARRESLRLAMSGFERNVSWDFGAPMAGQRALHTAARNGLWGLT